MSIEYFDCSGSEPRRHQSNTRHRGNLQRVANTLVTSTEIMGIKPQLKDIFLFFFCV